MTRHTSRTRAWLNALATPLILVVVLLVIAIAFSHVPPPDETPPAPTAEPKTTASP